MNKDTLKTLTSSKSNEWGTPISFFRRLNKEYRFTLDAATTTELAKCPIYYTKQDNSLVKSWGGNIVFLNPPYGRGLKHWVRKAYLEGEKPDTRVVMLIPARTDTIYFHEYVMKAAKVIFVKGRLKFEDGLGNTDPAPFPSMVVIFDNSLKKVQTSLPVFDTMTNV